MFKNSFVTGLIWGIIGGVTMALISNYSASIIVTLPYFIFLILSVSTVDLEQAKNKNLKLFSTGLWTFIIMTISIIVYLDFIAKPRRTAESTPTEYLLLGLDMLLIGAISSLVASFLVTRDLRREGRKAAFKNPVADGLVWGALGGLLLILTIKTADKVSLGWFFIPYALCLILSVITIDIKTAKNKYVKLFFASFLTYAFMSVILLWYYISLYKQANQAIPLLPYLKALSISLGWGVLASAGAVFAVTRNR